MKVLTLFGTRPEAIKMAPLVRRLGRTPGITSRICVTGQHRELLDPVLAFFAISPDHDLAIMQPGQSLNRLVGRMIVAIDEILEKESPDLVLVHGDTATALAGATASFHRRIRIGHVEAGLRTGDLTQPWPEEFSRRVVDVAADDLYAPTESSAENLRRENLGPKRILVTGNTVIDALFDARELIAGDAALAARLDADIAFLDPTKKTVLVTGHRRENFGDGFQRICEALAIIAKRGDTQIVYPVHLNPNVLEPVRRLLGDSPNIHLVKPMDYPGFVRLMDRSDLILTDSGGIQEEAPSLGKPVLVMREVTERPEAIAAGTVRLVGTDIARIVGGAAAHLDRTAGVGTFPANPYGDGHACERIIASFAR